MLRALTTVKDFVYGILSIFIMIITVIILSIAWFLLTVFKLLDIRNYSWWMAALLFYGSIGCAGLLSWHLYQTREDLTLANIRIETMQRNGQEHDAAVQTLCMAYRLSEPMADYYVYLFRKHAKQFGYPWEALAATMYIESRFRIDAKSHVGACGLMQLMPGTAIVHCRMLGIPYTPNHTLWQPTLNVYIGSSYFNECYTNGRDDITERLIEAFKRYIGGAKYHEGKQVKDYASDVLREYKKLTYIYKGILTK